MRTSPPARKKEIANVCRNVFGEWLNGEEEMQFKHPASFQFLRMEEPEELIADELAKFEGLLGMFGNLAGQPSQ